MNKLTLLSSFFVTSASSDKVLHFTYDPIEDKFEQKEFKVLKYYNLNIFPLDENQFLAQKFKGVIPDSKLFIFDMKTKITTRITDLEDITLINLAPCSKNFFNCYALQKRIFTGYDLSELGIIQLSKKDPTKINFKAIKFEKKPSFGKLKEVKQWENWLGVTNSLNEFTLYHRDNQDQSYNFIFGLNTQYGVRELNFKEEIKSEGKRKVAKLLISRKGENKSFNEYLYYLFENEFWFHEIGTNNELLKFSSVSLASDIIAIMGPMKKMVIKSYYQNENGENARFEYHQKFSGYTSPPVPLSETCFVIKNENSKLELWCDDFSNILPKYTLQSHFSKLEFDVVGIFSAPVSKEVRIKISSYLGTLIPVPKELVNFMTDFI